MTDDNWEEIVGIAVAKAKEMARESAVMRAKKEKPENTKLDNERRQRIEIIRKGLERYREEPEESNIRKYINWLLEEHSELQKCFTGSEKEEFKKRHNTIVLRYIIATPMSRCQIGKRLGTNCYGKENIIEKGIREMAALAFWDWELWDM